MRNYLINILETISRIIYRLTPHEFRKRKLNEYSVMDMYVLEEREKCYNHFKKYFKNSMLMVVPALRNYAIKQAIKNETNAIGKSLKASKTLFLFLSFLKDICIQAKSNSLII